MKKSIFLSIILIFGIHPIMRSSQQNQSFKWLSTLTAVSALGYTLYKVLHTPCSESSGVAQQTAALPLNWHSSKIKISPQSQLPDTSFYSIKIATMTEAAHQVDDLNVRIIPVLQQEDQTYKHSHFSDKFWDKEGTHCGYHALKNAMCALDLYQQRTTEFNGKNPDYYKNIAQPWIEMIKQQRVNHAYPLGDMLSGYDIDQIINTCLPLLYRQNITVIDQISMIEDHSKTTDVMLQMLNKFAQQSACAHAFIVNTDALKSTTHGYHWVVYFLIKEQDGSVRIDYMDSYGLNVNKIIAQKIQLITQMKKIDVEQVATSAMKHQVLEPKMQRIVFLLNQLSGQQDRYYYQGYATLDCSYALVNFEDLMLKGLLHGKTKEEIQSIKNAFEVSFSEQIQKIRKNKVVMIDGMIHDQLTKFHQNDLLQHMPISQKIFTFWKSNVTNQWHIEYESVSSESWLQNYLEKCLVQYGIKSDCDRGLRRYDIEFANDKSIEDLYDLLHSVVNNIALMSQCSLKEYHILTQVCVTLMQHVNISHLKEEIIATIHTFLQILDHNIMIKKQDCVLKNSLLQLQKLTISIEAISPIMTSLLYKFS